MRFNLIHSRCPWHCRYRSSHNVLLVMTMKMIRRTSTANLTLHHTTTTITTSTIIITPTTLTIHNLTPAHTLLTSTESMKRGIHNRRRNNHHRARRRQLPRHHSTDHLPLPSRHRYAQPTQP
ncbi:hypothetical protein Scep_003985 [Stephania cephalantha]|uniref:Uncharacterized protein n=1 Tax=Stephania cephalantha TaxID=152367 RepID=A0AAP0KRM9_9MAGN